MATIWERGPFQFCARVRRKGASETRTFETRKEAEDWAAIIEGKVIGEEPVIRSKARDTTLSQALDWYEVTIVPRTPRSAKGKLVQVRYWRASRFAQWALNALKPWDLIDWRR